MISNIKFGKPIRKSYTLKQCTLLVNITFLKFKYEFLNTWMLTLSLNVVDSI